MLNLARRKGSVAAVRAAKRRFSTPTLEASTLAARKTIGHSQDNALSSINHHVDASNIRLKFGQTRTLTASSQSSDRKNGTTNDSSKKRRRHNNPRMENASNPEVSVGARIPRRYVQDTEKLVYNNTSSWSVHDWKTAMHTLKGWRQQSHCSTTSVQMCWDLLNRMVMESAKNREQKRKELPTVQTKHLNLALDYLRIASGYPNVLDSTLWSASRILSGVEDFASRVPSLRPDVKSWTMIMALQTNLNPASAPEFNKKVMQLMTTAVANNRNSARPNCFALTQLMDSYVKSGDPQAPFEVQKIFEYMVEQANNGRIEMAPTEITLTKLLQAWIVGGYKRSASKESYLDLAREKIDIALEFFFQMDTKNPNTLTDSKSLDIVLNSCIQQVNSQHHSRRTAEECSVMVPLADFLFNRFLEEAKTSNPKLFPKGKAYSDMITLWSKSMMETSPEMAEEWLKRMTNASAERAEIEPPRPGVYASVMSAWESSGCTEAPYRGEILWREMVATASITEGYTHTGLAAGFHLLLSLWSKSALPEGRQKAEDLLRNMIVQHKHNETNAVAPTCRDFVSVISSWGKTSSSDKAAPYKAQEILVLMLEQYGSDRDFIINDTPFNSTIHSWASSGLPEAWSKVQELLELMKLESRKNPNVAPSIVTTYSSLQALLAVQTERKDKMKLRGLRDNATIDEIPDVVAEATSLLKYVENRSINPNKKLKGRIYECFLRLLSESGRSDAPYQAQKILQSCVIEHPILRRRFDTSMFSYQHVLDCWKENMHLPEARDRMLQLLSQMRKETDFVCENNARHATPWEPTLYIYILVAWARSGLDEAIDGAREVLQIMLEQSKEIPGHESKVKDWCSIVFEGLADSGQPDKAEQFVKDIVPVLVEESAQKSFSIATEMHGPLIDSWCKSNLPGATERARELLDDMIESYLEGTGTVKPSAHLFAPIMARYAQEGDVDMVNTLCDRLFELRIASNDDGDDADFLPNEEILSALSTCGEDRAAREAAVLHLVTERSRQKLEKGESSELLDREAFDSVLDSLARIGAPSSGKLAENILLRLQSLHEDGLKLDKPNFETFQKVLDCWAGSDVEVSTAAKRAEEIIHLAEELHKDGDKELEPTFEGYMSLIELLSRSFDHDAPERIQALLRKMQERSDSGNDSFQLDERAYIALANSYANSGRSDSARLAQTVFDATPDRFKCTELYNALILSQGGDSNRAEALLQEMHRAYLKGEVLAKPDTESFNNCILAWSRSGSPMAAWRADGIFKRMTELSDTEQLDVRPNGRTFDLVIAILSDEWGADAASKVDRYIELLKDRYESGDIDCKPSVTSFTEAIRAWGSNVEDPRAVLRAKALLDEMHELASSGVDSVKPNRHTYAVFLKALALSSVPDKDYVAQDVADCMQENSVVPDAAMLADLDQCYMQDE